MAVEEDSVTAPLGLEILGYDAKVRLMRSLLSSDIMGRCVHT